MQSKIDFYINQYLYNRPAFMAIIRSQEAIYFQKYLDLIKPIVLDYGCGDGFFAATVFGKRKIDIGLDLKNSRAQEAKQNRIYKKVVNYDGCKIPFPDNYFSTIIANCVFEHLPNLQSSLKELNRVLKPDGYLLTTVATDNWSKFLLGKKILGDSYVNWLNKKQEHHCLLSNKQWMKEFSNSGFKIQKEIGYMSQSTTRWMDLFHYLSIPALINYKLLGKWIIFPQLIDFLQINRIIKKIINTNNQGQKACRFYLLKKQLP